jgi:hypothetical protein
MKGLRDNYFGHFISCRVISNTNFLRLDPLLSSYIKCMNVGSKQLFSLTGQRLLYSFCTFSNSSMCIFIY